MLRWHRRIDKIKLGAARHAQVRRVQPGDELRLFDGRGHEHAAQLLEMGRKAVMEQFAKESTMGFRGTLVADERRFMETPDIGYLVCMERTSGMTQAGEAIQSDIRATTVFRKEAGHWRVVHHHTDRF